MTPDAHRQFKDRLYGQFARIGKALSSPHRLEILELLAQSERTVDSLATEIGLSLANTSQHLQALRQAALVESRKDGLFVYYRLAGAEVFELSRVLRTVGNGGWRSSNGSSASTSPAGRTPTRCRWPNCSNARDHTGLSFSTRGLRASTWL